MKKPAGTSEVPPPRGLRVTPVPGAEEDFVILSYPLPEWRLQSNLSSAEVNVVEGLLAGQSYAQIAGTRGTTPRTVANQVASAFRKLGVTSRIGLARVCRGDEDELDMEE